jgi:hypothetical protein
MPTVALGYFFYPLSLIPQFFTKSGIIVPVTLEVLEANFRFDNETGDRLSDVRSIMVFLNPQNPPAVPSYSAQRQGDPQDVATVQHII